MKTTMKTLLITALLACGFNPLYASGSHEHGHGHSHDRKEVSQGYAKQVAINELARLVQKGTIPKSWDNQTVANIDKKEFNHDMEWVFSFNNSGIKDAKKKTLYVFVNMYGEITGVNFTGL